MLNAMNKEEAEPTFAELVRSFPFGRVSADKTEVLLQQAWGAQTCNRRVQSDAMRMGYTQFKQTGSHVFSVHSHYLGRGHQKTR